MLFLILADRHMGRPIDENVSRHQSRIGIKADRGVFTILARFFLELGHAVQPAQTRDAIEHPSQFGMFGNLRLVEHNVLFGIDPAGQKGGCDLADALAQLRRILRHRDRVQIHHAINAIMAVLQRHEFGDGAEIIAQMQIPRRLHTRKYQLPE